MKNSLLLLALLAAATANAQLSGPGDALEARFTREASASLTRPETPALNRILGERFIYTGIVIELIRADNPLQLLNPLAPPQYGTAEQNVARDPITGRIEGLKLFCVSF